MTVGFPGAFGGSVKKKVNNKDVIQSNLRESISESNCQVSSFYLSKTTVSEKQKPL